MQVSYYIDAVKNLLRITLRFLLYITCFRYKNFDNFFLIFISSLYVLVRVPSQVFIKDITFTYRRVKLLPGLNIPIYLSGLVRS